MLIFPALHYANLMKAMIIAAVLAAPSSAGLHIVVVAGEDAVNIIQQKTAVAPIVEVRDRNNQPVAGAIVTFSITSGPNASFSGGVSTLSLTTNAAGRAAVAGMTPAGAGSVQINVAAAFQGQTATATITQTNFVTAAQASASGASTGAGSGSGGGGGLGAGQIVAIGAGVAAAGAVAALASSKKEETGPPPPDISEIRVEPSIAAQATPVQFIVSAGAGEGSTAMWDFGDGERSTAMSLASSQPVAHTYLSTGTFTASVTITDSQGRTASRQASVTIKSLTGRWTIDAGGFVDFVQSGTALAGTYTTGSTATSGTLIGVVGPGEVPGFVNFAPGVEFTVTANNRQQFRFVGSVASNTSVNGITGGFSTPAGIVVWRLTRQ